MSVRINPEARRRPRSFGISDIDSDIIDQLAARLGCSRSEVVVRAVRLLTLKLDRAERRRMRMADG